MLDRLCRQPTWRGDRLLLDCGPIRAGMWSRPDRRPMPCPTGRAPRKASPVGRRNVAFRSEPAMVRHAGWWGRSAGPYGGGVGICHGPRASAPLEQQPATPEFVPGDKKKSTGRNGGCRAERRAGTKHGMARFTPHGRLGFATAWTAVSGCNLPCPARLRRGAARWPACGRLAADRFAAHRIVRPSHCLHCRARWHDDHRAPRLRHSGRADQPRKTPPDGMRSGAFQGGSSMR